MSESHVVIFEAKKAWSSNTLLSSPVRKIRLDKSISKQE